MTDAVLFNKWRSERDAEAFRELASRYSGMVYATCLRVLRNPQEAEEAAQECFEKLAGAPRIASPYLGPWLHKVATNSALGRLRSEGRRRIREDRYAREHGIQHTPEWEDIYPLVDEAIAGLPEELRVPLVRHFLENRTHEAIALELGLSRTTITYRLQKALERVRRNLKRRGVEVASTAFAALLAEKMAEAAVVPATLEAALGCLAVAGLKVAPVTTGTATALLGGVMAKILVSAAVTVAAAGFAWQMLVPRQPSPVPARHAEGAHETTPPSRETGTASNSTPTKAASPKSTEEGGVITGRVFDAKTGRGIAGTEVYVMRGRDSKASAESNLAGDYRISGLAAGVYQVWQNGHAGYFNPNDRMIEATVDPQKPANRVDFALEPTIPLSGRVVSLDGTPVSGALVAAISYGALAKGNAQSRSDGTFVIDMPKPGKDIRIQAKSEKFQSAVVKRDSLEPEGLSGVELVLDEPLSAGVEGRLLLADGKAAAGYPLRLNEGWSIPLMQIPDVNTEADGSFMFKEIAAGTYCIFLYNPEQGRLQQHELARDLKVDAGEALKGVELMLPSQGNGLSISGRVVDTAGKAVAQASVTACRGGVKESAVTDERGSFTLTGLEDDKYYIRVEPTDGSFSSSIVSDIQAGTQGLQITVEGVARIEGYVVNSRDDKPVTQFETYLFRVDRIELTPELLENRPRVINDPEGLFVFEKVETGPETLIVKAPGFAIAKQVIEVHENQTVNGVEIRLEPAKLLTGNVVDSQGRPVADASIYFVGEQRARGSKPFARTGADGTFTLELLFPDALSVVAYHPLYPETMVDINNLDNIVLQEGGTVEGYVTVNGTPPGEGIVSAKSGKRSLGFKICGADGFYRLETLPAGTLQLEATCKNGRKAAQNVVITPGEKTALDFAFAPEDACVEGNVTLSGKAIEDASVFMRIETEAGEEIRRAKTGLDGHYLLSGLPSGAAHLTTCVDYPDQQKSYRRVELNILPGSTIRQDFQIDAPGVIKGLVSGTRPNFKARVLLLPADAIVPSDLEWATLWALELDHAIGFAYCSADGSYELDRVAPGDYIVLAIHGSGPTSNQIVATQDCVTVGDGVSAVIVNFAPR